MLVRSPHGWLGLKTWYEHQVLRFQDLFKFVGLHLPQHRNNKKSNRLAIALSIVPAYSE